MKEKLFSIFFCIYLFWNSILSSVLGQNGIEMDGMIMRLTLVAIFAIAFYFYMTIKPRVDGERKVWIYIVLFAVLYYSTQYINSSAGGTQTMHQSDFKQMYMGQFLRWGSDCVPGCLIGMTLLKLKDYSFIHKILPWLCLLLTPFMAVATLTMGRLEGQMHIEGGMNYQTVAYQMAVLCCYGFYYTFIYKERSSKIVKIIMLPTMLLQAVCCLMSGGRGGVVLLAVYALYMIYFLHTRKKVSILRIILVGFALIVAFFSAADYLGLQDSSGFARSSGLTHDDDRFEFWSQYTPFFSQNPLLGWGLGGDYFTVGFYSHNIFIDWMLETGIVGTIILARIFYKSYKRLYELTGLNEIFVVVMIFFIYGFVMNLFSGYWISTSSNWMAFGISMTYLYAYRKQNTLSVNN